MPLSGNDKPTFKIFFFIFILTFLTSVNAFSQTKDLTAQEEKLADLYHTMVSFFYTDKDSLELYATKFEKEFKGFIKSNPGTLQYDFKKLSEEDNICQIQTSSDGNLRIYNWDTENSGPVHYHKSIYQWKSNGKVFTNIGDVNEDVDGGNVCVNLYTVMIDNKAHYLVIRNSEGSGKDRSESISAYRIDGEKLNDTVKVFRTRTETLNSIIVNIDNFNVVDDYNQDEGITYDAKRKIVSIPLVNENHALTNNYLLYKLKGRYFEYIGTNAFAQTNKFAAQEAKLATIYSKMLSNRDSVDFYSLKFEKEIKDFVQKNPGTLNYRFKKLDEDSGFCSIKTSADRKFRIYSWNTWMGGSMRIYKEFYQWKGNGKVFVKTPQYMDGSDEGCFCYDLYTVLIKNRMYYLASKLSVASGRDRVYYISAYRIDGDKLLDSVKLFKTKTELLNTIYVEIDMGNVVEPYKRDDESILYDPRLKRVYVPLVNGKNELTSKNLLYQLKGRYFEYIGVEPGRRRSTK